MIITCKHCNKKFFLGIGFARHLLVVHNINITANDRKCLRKKRIKFIFLPIISLLWLLKWIVIIICFPFHWIYDTLVYEV